MLCADLFNFDHTPDAATRAYAVTAAKAPPMPPGEVMKEHFDVVYGSIVARLQEFEEVGRSINK